MAVLCIESVTAASASARPSILRLKLKAPRGGVVAHNANAAELRFTFSDPDADLREGEARVTIERQGGESHRSVLRFVLDDSAYDKTRARVRLPVDLDLDAPDSVTVTLRLIDRSGKRSVAKAVSAKVRPNPWADRIAQVENGLIDSAGNSSTLVSRMAFHDVPGVAIALIDDFRIVWAKGYGERRRGRSGTVNNETLFQAGSISKPVSVLAAVRMMHEGLIDGDADVNDLLTSWQVPSSNFTTSQKVTVRGLATHSGGFTLTGFPGYAEDGPLPTAVQILDGVPPANTPPIRVGHVPGSRFFYSGGGTQVLQQVLTDIAGATFPDLMREWVFVPTRMHHSTFEHPLPSARRNNTAVGHASDLVLDDDDVGVVHPEMAAAGLWSTASDLARHLLALMNAYHGRGPEELPQAMVREMLTENMGGMGMGWYVGHNDAGFQFHHGGATVGFRAIASVLAERGDGPVILTNGTNGETLYNEILRAFVAADAAPTGSNEDRSRTSRSRHGHRSRPSPS